MINPMFCNVCSDKNHANTVKWELENIINRLQQLGATNRNDYRYCNDDSARRINYDNVHVHMMCEGACLHSPVDDIRILNEKIHALSYDLLMQYREGKISNAVIHEALHMYAGRYSNIHRVFSDELRRLDTKTSEK